jgi:glycosyltransferase involved in cell wall biosynthesis
LPGVTSILDHRPARHEYPAIAYRLYKRLRRRLPDAVITHTTYSNIMGQAIAAALGVPKRIAVHQNDLPSHPPVARAVDCILGHVGVYSRIVGVSDSVVQSTRHYLSRYTKLVSRIYNCVAPVEPIDLADIKRQGVVSSQKVLLSVGRLSRQKNHRTLFQALCHVPNVSLIVAGDGELASELREQVAALSLSDRVVFTGEVNEEQIYRLMRRADLFVFPSLWEGFSLAAVEALNAGMATVTSDIPPNREVFGDAALFVQPTDVAALARAITRVLGNASLTKELRSKALLRARNFSLDTLVNEYEQLICSR